MKILITKNYHYAKVYKWRAIWLYCSLVVDKIMCNRSSGFVFFTSSRSCEIRYAGKATTPEYTLFEWSQCWDDLTFDCLPLMRLNPFAFTSQFLFYGTRHTFRWSGFFISSPFDSIILVTILLIYCCHWGNECFASSTLIGRSLSHHN